MLQVQKSVWLSSNVVPRSTVIKWNTASDRLVVWCQHSILLVADPELHKQGMLCSWIFTNFSSAPLEHVINHLALVAHSIHLEPSSSLFRQQQSCLYSPTSLLAVNGNVQWCPLLVQPTVSHLTESRQEHQSNFGQCQLSPGPPITLEQRRVLPTSASAELLQPIYIPTHLHGYWR